MQAPRLEGVRLRSGEWQARRDTSKKTSVACTGCERRCRRSGAASYDEVSVESDEVYAVVRRLGDARSVLLVNLSDKRLETTCAIDLEPPVPAGDGLLVFDAWNDRAIDVDLRYALDGATLRWLPLVFEPYQTRLLVLRPRCPR
jgi:hypothetical protein